jgi:hypothetical protein
MDGKAAVSKATRSDSIGRVALSRSIDCDSPRRKDERTAPQSFGYYCWVELAGGCDSRTKRIVTKIIVSICTADCLVYEWNIKVVLSLFCIRLQFAVPTTLSRARPSKPLANTVEPNSSMTRTNYRQKAFMDAGSDQIHVIGVKLRLLWESQHDQMPNTFDFIFHDDEISWPFQ